MFRHRKAKRVAVLHGLLVPWADIRWCGDVWDLFWITVRAVEWKWLKKGLPVLSARLLSLPWRKAPMRCRRANQRGLFEELRWH